MSETNFKPLFEYFDEIKDELKSDIRRVEGKVDILQTSVDGFAKITKNTQEEITVINNRLEKLETKTI
jgi:outer membrane murein-binding lipoprotein Lpp